MQKSEIFVNILKEELVPALGCTEPIAIALAATKAREVLNAMPERVEALVSGNIIKNVKSVVVPGTNGLKGIDAACLTGIAAGDSSLNLEVLRGVTASDVDAIKKMLKDGVCKVSRLDSDEVLHIIVKLYAGNESSEVEIKRSHANIVRIVKNGETLFDKELERADDVKLDVELKDIYDYADSGDITPVIPTIKRQIEYNTAICREGLKGEYGQSIGRTLIGMYGDETKVKARALAAAGSDARMNGCSLPVVINSGSGNQGITVCVPVVVFGESLKVSEETLLRSLVLSNLIAIYLKRGIGKLSAYCGVVSASCGAGAGITYVCGGNFEHISKTITNTIANVSGIVCDGAKSSCAAKIASSVDAAILGHFMSMTNKVFASGDGIVKSNVERTIEGVSRIGKDGMRETDNEILDIMLEND